MEPAELPIDLETLSDEERFLFRKIGLSMKPFLLLGMDHSNDSWINDSDEKGLIHVWFLCQEPGGFLMVL